MNQMKFHLLIICVIFFFNSHAQESWGKIYDTPGFKDGPATKLAIDSQGNFFIGISTFKKNNGFTEGKYSVFKIAPEGSYLDSLDFEFNINVPSLSNIMIIDDTLFLAGVNRFQEENIRVFTTEKYDVDFNLIDSKSYILPDSLLSLSTRDIIHINNNFVVTGSFDLEKFDSSPINGIALLEFNHQLDSVNFKFYEDGFALPFSIVESYDNNLITPTIGWWYNNIDTTINGTLPFGFFSGDNLMPLYTRIIPSMFLNNGAAIKQFPDSSYIVSAEHSFFSAKNVAVFKISSDFEILDSIVISSTPEHPGPNATFGQTLDYIDPEAIYFGSTNNIYGFPDAVDNWIRIVKLNSELDIIWEKFYGGHANYFCYTVKATEDGGCIVLATRFDFENDPDPNHLGTYILKLGPDGILTGIEESSLQVKEVLVYPNPGRELNIATGFNNYSLTLFDINGKAVYNRRALTRDSKHDLSFLPGGLYIYRVISEKGEVLDTGKWVRE